MSTTLQAISMTPAPFNFIPRPPAKSNTSMRSNKFYLESMEAAERLFQATPKGIYGLIIEDKRPYCWQDSCIEKRRIILSYLSKSPLGSVQNLCIFVIDYLSCNVIEVGMIIKQKISDCPFVTSMMQPVKRKEEDPKKRAEMKLTAEEKKEAFRRDVNSFFDIIGQINSFLNECVIS